MRKNAREFLAFFRKEELNFLLQFHRLKLQGQVRKIELIERDSQR